METDETLSALRHEYHLLKDKVNETANDWAALSYLQNLVEAHIKQIKDKRLPYVVKDATDILKALTEGRYNQVIYCLFISIRIRKYTTTTASICSI